MVKFLEYARAYDQSNGKVNLKIVHTQNVARVMDQLSEVLGLDARMRRLAHACGVYHDIGRFEQIRQYGTFNDAESVDHAALSCQVLKDGDFLDEFSKKEQEMILTAIANHNRYAIEAVTDEDTLLLCKLIRDADKLDIFRVFATEDMVDTMGETIAQVETEEVSDPVMQSIMDHQCVIRSQRVTGLDKWVAYLGFAFDLNFPESFAIMRREGNYRRQFDLATFEKEETRQKVAIIMQELENYITDRIDNGRENMYDCCVHEKTED